MLLCGSGDSYINVWGHAESEFDFTARLSKNKHDYIILKAFVKKQKLDI